MYSLLLNVSVLKYILFLFFTIFCFNQIDITWKEQIQNYLKKWKNLTGLNGRIILGIMDKNN